jgi:hypothetical protein
MAKIAGSREVTEAQASIMVAKRFPRNEMEIMDKVLLACQMPRLAESALYQYSRGGTEISGPSIRMAETLFRIWGNGACGLRELESRAEESLIEAYAVDYETNIRQSKIFTVRHERTTKKGTYALEDGRDRYENLANFGARRLRACILSLIPVDLTEAAVSEVERTLKATADLTPEGLKKLVTSFAAFGVTKEQIEKRIQRRLDTVSAGQVVGMKKIYTSLRDGMSTPADWFETDTPAETPKTGAEAAKEALRGKKGKNTQPPETTTPAASEDASYLNYQPLDLQGLDVKTGEVKLTTTRDKAEMITCPRDGESRSVGWCSDACVTAIDCTDWR